MQLKQFLCCEGISIDQRHNNVSIFTIIDEITPGGLPVFLQKMTVFAAFQREESEPNEVALTLNISSGGKILSNNPVSVSFQGKLRFRFVAEIQGLVIPQVGPLIFELSLQGNSDPLGTYIIDVKAPVKPSMPTLVVSPATP